ncbi:Uncharacterized conserved protein, contains ParB-like and HNH nuclease domains [Ruminococcaceae bacterium FB2012]|nr:Uncharacterized conserved protein, contains ParB-like and HNH nuclease domains [Ruminococcaceae bacterium FB2012]
MDEHSTNPLDRQDRKTDIITVAELFSSSFVYRVPDYQRGYAWNDEFKMLWKDILRLYRTKAHKHYTGMLVLEEIKDDAVLETEAIIDTTAFYIVDGQQRITSLVIILQSLLNYVQDEITDNNTKEELEKKYKELLSFSFIKRFGYSAKRNDPAASYFDERIYDNSAGAEHTDQYMSNINDAKDFIDKELDKLSGETAAEILDVIANKIVFNLYFVTDDFDVRVTFETINNRGKRLSKLELLKNRLMYLSAQLPKRQGLDLKNKINDSWKSIYKNLCFGDCRLSDDVFLKAHWIVYGKLNKKKGDSFFDDLFADEFAIDEGTHYNLVANKEYDNAYSHIEKYIRSLSRYSYYWRIVNQPEGITGFKNEKELEWIKRLSRISDTLFLRAALMVIVSLDSINWPDKEKLYNKIELFVFVNKLLAQDRNDLSFLVTAVKPMLTADNTNATKLCSDVIQAIDSHPSLKVDPERVVKAVEAFKLNVLDRKENYYYSWNGLSYFLYEYNESLSIANAAPIQWYELSSTSIEHVLPQTPESDYWKTSFGDYSDDVRKRITNSLGNLLLLSCGAENSTLRNYSFPVKKDMSVASKKFAYSDGSRSAREIAEETYWTINEVTKRTQRLIKFMYEHWFSNLSIAQADWEKCSSILMNDLPAPLTDKEYAHKTQLLDKIDTTAERKKADASVKARPSNFLQKQFLGYVNQDSIWIRYNKEKISYKDWFTFKIIEENGNPKRFECGVKINDISYRIIYHYDNNTMEGSYWPNNNYTVIPDEALLPNKIKELLLSFKRYLRKARNITKPPKWLDYSANSK